MKSMKPFLIPMGCLALILSWAPTQAHASLGGGEASVDADLRALHARQKEILIRDLYQVREIACSRQTVREYISSDGTVFAVTWKGKASPDLSQLLGAYYPEYLGPSHARSGRLVAQSSVGARDLSGRAYVPELLPRGVNPAEIR